MVQNYRNISNCWRIIWKSTFFFSQIYQPSICQPNRAGSIIRYNQRGSKVHAQTSCSGKILVDKLRQTGANTFIPEELDRILTRIHCSKYGGITRMITLVILSNCDCCCCCCCCNYYQTVFPSRRHHSHTRSINGMLFECVAVYSVCTSFRFAKILNFI